MKKLKVLFYGGVLVLVAFWAIEKIWMSDSSRNFAQQQSIDPRQEVQKTKVRFYDQLEPSKIEDDKCKKMDNGRALCRQDYDEIINRGSLEDVRQFAVEKVKEWYRMEEGFMDFSNSIASETIFVRDNHPRQEGTDLYVTVLRNGNNEVTALTELLIKGRDPDHEYLSFGSAQPTAAAYYATDQKTGKTPEELREKETFPMREKFPLVGEEDSANILAEFFQKKGETPPSLHREGYSNIYIPSTVEGQYDLVAGGDYFHEYIIDGNPENKIWVRASDGTVFDQKRLEWVQKKNKEHEDDPQSIWTDQEKYEP